MNSSIALIGNPNVGKTSLFNVLTNTYQKVGNWTGVTVEKVEMPLYNDKSIKIVDLPGVYSINGDSLDERAVPEYLKKTPPKVIVNIVDGTNLERSLSLTLSLLKLNIPMILAVNFSDELIKNDIRLDKELLSKILDIPVVMISAKKNIGIDELVSLAKTYDIVPKKTIPFSEKEIAQRVYKRTRLKGEIITDRIDKIILNKLLALPIFALVIFVVYFLSLKIGGLLGDCIANFFDAIKDNTTKSLTKINSPNFLISFITVALLGGVGEVLSFLPQVIILFGLLAFLEESGYMSRVAFLLDRIFRGVGMSGKSVFALVLSLGCTVSGIMATRTIEDEREREKTIFLIPFMPCGAKVVVFAWASKIFFNGSPLIATSLFFLGLLVIIIVGKLTLKGDSSTFLLEMPLYRLPSVKNTFSVMKEKLKDFTFKAGSVIFIVSIVYWFLLYFGINGYNNGTLEQSFLYLIGNTTKYIFYPLGYYDWRISTSIISGLLARESIIETLTMSTANISSIFKDLKHIYSFLVFTLLSPPCTASLSQAKSELKSVKKLTKMFCFEFVVAYLVAFFINLW